MEQSGRNRATKGVCFCLRSMSNMNRVAIWPNNSMFLRRRQTYPTYGFFILNRMGTEDYIRPIYPEDDMDIVGQYVMYRFYPDFTRKRLELRLPYPIPDEYRAIFDEAHDRSVEDPQASAGKIKEKKGKSTTIGLWMFATDSREPLTAVMMRYGRAHTHCLGS